MQLQELEIDSFGVWRDVNFPFQERGVNVLYGPNEAGKSTLMRFMRGVLYGYQPRDEVSGGPNPRPVECSGSLRVHHRGQDYRLTRVSQPGTRGRLEVNGRVVRDDDPLVRELTGNTSEGIFQNIFAIGLHELQQLATLNGDDVARHIYGLSLGPEGEQILQAHQGFGSELERLLGAASHSGELLNLSRQLGTIDKELARRGPLTENYSKLQSELRSLELDIEGGKRKQADLQHNLRARQYLSRVHEPWRKEQDVQRQLQKLPMDDVDREILNRFDEIEFELSEVDDRRKSLINEARKLQQDAERIETRPELEQQTCPIQNLFERSRAMQALEKTLSTPRAQQPRTDRDVEDVIARLGAGWDRRRLERTQVSPSDLQKLFAQAQRTRAVARSRARLIKRFKRGGSTLKTLQVNWKRTGTSFTGQNAADVRTGFLKRISDLEELRGLRMRRDQLRRTLGLLKREVAPRLTERELPPFFWMILWFFTIGGGVLFLAGAYAAAKGYDGIVAGTATAWIVGLSFTLLGLCCMGTFWALKQYFETVEFQAVNDGDERRTIEQELQKTEQAMDRLIRKESPTASHAPAPVHSVGGPDINEEEIIRQLRKQLSEIDRSEPDKQRIEKLRTNLAKVRERLQTRQKDFGRARREWTETLRRMGLSDTLKVADALAECQRLAEAKSTLLERETTGEKDSYQRSELENFRKAVRELAAKITGRDAPVHDPYELLAGWQRELVVLEERRRERARLRQLAKDKRKEAASHVEKIERLRQQRTAALKRLNVADRGEIALKLAAIDERKTLEHQLQQIRGEIQKIAASESDLAIVEDDLLKFDAAANRAAIDKLRADLAQHEDSLRGRFEKLGVLKSQLREIEDDRTLTTLRFEREQILHALGDATERWCSAKIADHLVNDLRAQIEQNRQPQTLQSASESLRQLTCGKYRRIWTRLGEKTLLVDDEHGQALRIEHLSSGTREQVFLATRLAMIRDFARQGTELPLILDDVTVNFDHNRTQAAVETLLNVSKQGQQVLLFTCHLHLARNFEERGLEPIWLPGQQPEAHVQYS